MFGPETETQGTQLAAGSPKRILVLANKGVGMAPGQRFRLEQWGKYTAEDGFELEFQPFESSQLSGLLYDEGKVARKAALLTYDFGRRFKTVMGAGGYDGVIVYREAATIGPAINERLLKLLGIPFLFDFDDAIWESEAIKASRSGLFARLKFPAKTRRICRMATAVTAGNAYLAAYARQFNKTAVHILPTSIDLDDYDLQPELAEDSPFVIGWTGSTTTLAHFETLRPVLEEVARRRPTTVKVICNEAPAEPIAGARNIFVPWQADREAEEVGACHVGIMPLPDDRYARGKCGLKALQFMATGRPVIASPVGMNLDLIAHGINGFLPQTEGAWLEAFGALAESAALRRSVGLAGRARVEEQFSARVVASRFSEILRSTFGASSQSSRG